MKAPLRFALFAVMVLVVAGGCAQSQPQVTSGPPANVAGTWTGSVGAGGQSTSASLVLQQQGGVLTGSAEVGGRPDLSGDLKGTVNGNAVTYNLTSGYGTTVYLTVSGDRMQGIIGGNQAQLQKSR